MREAPIALMYKSAALPWNFKVCLEHGGEVQSYFSCPPPSFEDYISFGTNLNLTFLQVPRVTKSFGSFRQF